MFSVSSILFPVCLLVIFSISHASPTNYSHVGKSFAFVKASDSPTSSDTIRGIITDHKNIPIIGATVYVKETPTVGTISDPQGRFKIRCATNQTLHISYIGYISQDIKVIDRSPLSITLEENPQALGEVIVNGIFERKKESFTGAATVIRRDELMRSGNRNLLKNLKNIDPGFHIVENLDLGSDPNRLPQLVMRGQQGLPDIKGAFSGNPNQPLFVLDGFEADLSTVYDLDMDRVETVVLLKDAAAKAIYGSRAANGVVVIETRRPKPGELRVSYKGEVNLTVPDLTGYNLTNAYEKYVVERDNDVWGQESGHPEFAIFREQYLNAIIRDINRGIDTYWLSKPLRVGVGDRHSLYLEGGDEKVRYAASAMYNDIRGVMKGSDRKTFTGGFTLSYRYRNLLFRNLFNATLNRADDSPYGEFREYTQLNPYWSPYDEDGELKKILGKTGGGGIVEDIWGNPLYNATLNTKNFGKYTELSNNFYIEWQVMSSLKLVGRAGLLKRQDVREEFYPASHTKFLNYKDDRFFERGSYSKIDGENHSISLDLNANYSRQLDKHLLYINAGYNLREYKSQRVGFEAEGFPNDNMDFIAFAKQFRKNSRPSGSESIQRELGLLGALNYSYDDRYLLDLSYRANASSMFGKDNRWGHFWSVGAGWNLHNEGAIRDWGWLNQWKIRASSGYTGSQNFNPYQAMATFGYYGDQAYDNWIGSYLLGLPNDDLKGQKTLEHNIGMDVNILGRVSSRLDYYIQNTADQLLDLTIPPSLGFTSYKENLGSTRNVGVEWKVNARVWESDGREDFINIFTSIASNRNKILKISNALKRYNDEQDEEFAEKKSNVPVIHFKEGESLTAIWAVQSLGIDPASGKEFWLTKDGEITSIWDPRDQVVCGDTSPLCNGTFGVNMEYRGVSFNALFSYRLGGQIYNQTLVDRVENANIRGNVDKRIYDAVWKSPNDHVAYRFNPWNITMPTSRFVQDLNELSLSTLSVGYNFKGKSFVEKWNLKELKMYFYMNDVFRASSVEIERGLTYPFARTFSFTLQTTF